MKKDKVIPFKDKKAKNKKEVSLKGTIQKLKYEVYYELATLHIYDDKLLFKKDLKIFEDELTNLDFNTLKENETFIIKGSGDNDSLIFCKKEGDIVLSLKKREFKIIEQLKNILNRSKEFSK
jgi:hypothetical protein